MKGIVVFLFLAITQSLLPLSSYALDLQPQTSLELQKAHKAETSGYHAVLQDKDKEEVALVEIYLDEAEGHVIEPPALSFHSPYSSLILAYVAEVRPPTRFKNFTLIYISRLITSPPAVLA